MGVPHEPVNNKERLEATPNLQNFWRIRVLLFIFTVLLDERVLIVFKTHVQRRYRVRNEYNRVPC